MKDILKIVITGGPCAGKTTALEKIAEFLRDEGYTVLFCNEAATELIGDGVRPFGDINDRLPLIHFQRLILDDQVAKEDIRIDAANHVLNPKVAILFDRGILDNRAYITNEEFKELSDKKGLTEEEILKRYNLVIHLVSTAVDKEEVYVGTATRKENVEEARALDGRTMDTWAKHKRHVVIYNNCSFNGKIALVIDEIKKYLGIKRDLVTKKYLVKSFDYKELLEAASHISHLQIRTFISHEDEEYRHLYTEVIDNSADPSYTFSETYFANGEEVTTKRQSSKSEFLVTLKATGVNPLKITRYIITTPDRTFRLDVYHEGLDFTTIEVDDTKELPSFVNEYIDITDNEEYKIENLCKGELPNQYRKMIK